MSGETNGNDRMNGKFLVNYGPINQHNREALGRYSRFDLVQVKLSGLCAEAVHLGQIS